MIVADTDVLIDFLGEREPAAGRVTRELENSLLTTAITRFELLSGARGAREVGFVSELLDSIKIAPLDVYAADCVALVRRTLERKGVGIGMADSLIAGIELHIGGIVLTCNRRHFGELEGSTLRDLNDQSARIGRSGATVKRFFWCRLKINFQCSRVRSDGRKH